MDGEFGFPPFEGFLEKIVVESERSGFLMPPEWEGEIRQRLTMRRNGSVALTRYYISPGNGTKSMKRYRYKPTEKIMDYIRIYHYAIHMTEGERIA